MVHPRGILIEASDGCHRFLTDVNAVKHLDEGGFEGNAEQLALLVDSYLCLLADSPLSASGDGRVGRPLRAYYRFRKLLLSEPLDSIIKRFSNLAHEIVSSTRSTGEDAYTGTFIEAMKETPVFPEYLKWFRTGDPLLLQYLLSFLWFAKKMDYEDPGLDATAFHGWLEVERKLSDLRLPEQRSKELSMILEWLIGNFRFSSRLEPMYGPGKVAEPDVVGEIAKSNAIRFDPKVDRLLFRADELVFRGSVDDGFHPDKVLPDPSKWNKASARSSNTSKLEFVAKDRTKSRSICKEPNTNMMAQQMVRRDLNRAFRFGPMKRFVTLEDQSRNRVLAQFGSYTTEVDTIDLSSASDSVHQDLVRLMPIRLRYAQLATRTSFVELPNGKRVRVNKFAPMGSALCFPTQCLVFVGLSLLAHALYVQGIDSLDLDTPCEERWLGNGGRRLMSLIARDPGYHYLNTKGPKFNPLVVYGDDIVIDTRITPHLVHLLTAFGFTVNLSKSFTAGQGFRESCGGFYWQGHDVTPLLFRIKRVTSGNAARHVASMIALANTAGDRGLRHLRSYLVHRLLELTQNHIAFTHDRNQNARIFTERPGYNSHLKHREQPKSSDLSVPWYDREEMRCTVFLPETRVRPTSEEEDAYQRYLYRKWWRGTTGESVDRGEITHGILPLDLRGVKLGRRWTPTS